MLIVVGNWKKNEYKHDNKSRLLIHLLLYKFWQFETGIGLPWYFAHIDDVRSFAESKGCTINMKFFNDMLVHNTKLLDNLFK